MDLQPRGYDKVVRLIEKGVTIPNPLSLDIGEDVDIDRISAQGVTIYPGCRIYGPGTVISSGCRLGAEGPVTLDDCRLGPKVDLKGGYFKKSVFLEKANMGLGAQVREGCLLEEEANGAHCVGLKQTILFPFVTLGSLINLCDCLMSGGTGRKDHSEVGSSYVHFNYTPDGDKTTASLFGDVPRGVMLDQPPIFLGGQGGAVGPVRLGYGTVVAAGSILRHDVLDDGQLVVVDPLPGFTKRRRSQAYSSLNRMTRNNVLYLANLTALDLWYRNMRERFFARQEFGDLVYAGALDILALARSERCEQLRKMAVKVPKENLAGRELRDRIDEVCEVLSARSLVQEARHFPEMLEPTQMALDYVEAVRSLTPAQRAVGIQWLEDVVASVCQRADAILVEMDLFGARHPA